MILGSHTHLSLRKTAIHANIGYTSHQTDLIRDGVTIHLLIKYLHYYLNAYNYSLFVKINYIINKINSIFCVESCNR